MALLHELNPEIAQALANPAIGMPAFGTVLDQSTDQLIPYDPLSLNPNLHRGILNYYGNTPRTESGHTKFLVVIASRQSGKSFCAAACNYYRTAYVEANYSVMIADTRERADTLFRNTMLQHDHMDPQVRIDSTHGETRQISFHHGGAIRALSAGSNMTGIGRSISSGHLSECPFMLDFGGLWYGLRPALTNRKNVRLVMESTPAPMDKPSAEAFRDTAAEARRASAAGTGRWAYLFSPFYESRLNERPWPKDSSLTLEEQRLMDKFGPRQGQPASASGAPYLTLENLAFRREELAGTDEMRRDPGLFWVFYPVDQISCWHVAGSGAIRPDAIEATAKRSQEFLTPWKPNDGEYQEYSDPRPDGIYVMGVDPAGWTGGDQAAFVILELWEDQWRQVAGFSSNNVTPPDFAERIITAAARYNHCEVVVENNGVGLGTLTALHLAQKQGRLKRLYSANQRKPGIPATAKSINSAMSMLVSSMLPVSQGGYGTLTLADEELLDQLKSYRSDKLIQDSDKFRIMNPGKTGKGKRGKHHWDRVSGLLWAVHVAANLPVKRRPELVDAEAKRRADNANRGMLDLSADELAAYYKLVEKDRKSFKNRSF